MQETRGNGEWRERIRASRPALPRYLRPLAGSLDDSEPPRVAEDRDRLAGQPPGSPRSAPKPPPALGSLCLSEDTICISPASPCGMLGVDWVG